MYLLGLYRRLLAAQIRSQLQYRVAFVFDVLASMFFVFTDFAALVLVFQRFEQIGGWTLPEVALLYGLIELSFGLMDMIFGGFDPALFSQYIRKGTLDQLLLRPANLVVQVFGSDFALRRLGGASVGVGIFVYALSQVSIEWTLAKLLYLPLVVMGMILFFGGLFMVGATITIWTVESVETINIFTYGGKTVIGYPMHIYQEWMRRLFTFVIPAIFLNYYPALYFLGKPDPFGMPYFVHFIAPFVGALMFAIALRFWFFGLKHYASTGS